MIPLQFLPLFWPALCKTNVNLHVVQLYCTDAGADLCSYVSEHTGYDLLQNTANSGQFEAVVKLVEAGASWRLQWGQARTTSGAVWYVPEILSVVIPGLKVRTMICCLTTLPSNL
jgi:hypothetical protein